MSFSAPSRAFPLDTSIGAAPEWHRRDDILDSDDVRGRGLDEELAKIEHDGAIYRRIRSSCASNDLSA